MAEEGDSNCVTTLLDDGGRGRNGRGDYKFNVDAHDFTISRPETAHVKQGKWGTVLPLRANFARITSPNSNVMPEILVFQHHVEFEPPLQGVQNRINFMKKCLVEEGLDEDQMAFDGTVLYLPTKLSDMGEEGLKEFQLNLGDGDSQQKMIVYWIKNLSPSSPLCLTVFNFINQRILELLGYRRSGRNFFSEEQAKPCEAFNLSLWPGFELTMRSYDGGLLYNIEQTHKIISNKSVLEIITQAITGRNKQSDIQLRRVKCQEILEGQIVMTKNVLHGVENYFNFEMQVLRYNKKTYRVDQIAFNKSPRTTFQKSGIEISYKDYYKLQYGIQILDEAQPLLLSKRGRKISSDPAVADVKGETIFLIPELCVMTGISSAQRKDRLLMQSLSQVSRLDPSRRMAESELFLSNIRSSSFVNKQLNGWNLAVGNNLISLNGRQLPEEELIFGKDQKIVIKKGEWSKEARKMPVKDFVPLKRRHWVMVFVTKDFNLAKRLHIVMSRVSHLNGLKFFEPECVEVEHSTPEAFIGGIREGFARVEANFQCKPILVLFLVPNDSKERYDALKHECCVVNPIPSQVVLTTTVRKDKLLESIATKISHQINCKVGGAPWKVVNKFSKLVMHVGYDTYRDVSMKDKMAGAAVFTMDRDWTKWYTCSQIFRLGSPNQATHFKDFFIEALAEYKKRSGVLPDKIFLWRDGVSEGQIQIIFNVELPEILIALKDVYHCISDDQLDEKMQFTFTIVTKTLNTRFFLEDGGHFSNPPPGTVVDTVVTRKERYDFFLIPQQVGRGAVTPVNYNIIHDRNMLGPDKMQILAYRLCHLYYNWQGTVRVPAPCMYACKAAMQVGQSLHSPINKKLADKLVYI